MLAVQRRTFTDEFKKDVVRRMNADLPPSFIELAKELDVHGSQLYEWRRKYPELALVKDGTPKPKPKPKPNKKPKTKTKTSSVRKTAPSEAEDEAWSAEEQLDFLIELGALGRDDREDALAEAQLSESDVASWRKWALDGLLRSPEDVTNERITQLEAELKRRDAALSRAAMMLLEDPTT